MADRRSPMLIRLYADVSGKDPDPIRVAAGLIASEERWERFKTEWARALNEAEVTQFHAKDFYARPPRGEFKSWELDSPKHKRFSKWFCAIAVREPYAGFATGIEVEPFRRLLAPKLKGLKSTPNAQMTSLMMCATDLLHDATEFLPSGVQVAALFEAEEGIGQVIGYFDSLKRSGVPWTEKIVSVGRGDKSFMPIQASDLLGHASFRHLRRIARRQGEPEMERPLKRLVKEQKVKITMLTEEYLTPVLPTIQQYLDEGTLI
jgi:hypothetical protein